MRTGLSRWLVACSLGLFPLCGCEKIKRNFMPVPIVVAWEPVYQPFADNEARVKVRNTGDSGYVIITFRDGGQQWTTRQHFNSGEERTVLMPLKGCRNFKGTNQSCQATAD